MEKYEKHIKRALELGARTAKIIPAKRTMNSSAISNRCNSELRKSAVVKVVTNGYGLIASRTESMTVSISTPTSNFTSISLTTSFSPTPV